MVIKTVFKSHFKFKKNFLKNSKKKVFIKNMVVFLLFTKFFFKGCVVNFFFTKNRNTQTNILKAPSRHKKFFHQIFFEYYTIKINFFFTNSIFRKLSTIRDLEKPNTSLKNLTLVFKNLNILFKKIGSNTLNRTKLSISFVQLLKKPQLTK